MSELLSEPNYNVMIVDDEPIIRKALVNIIDWRSLHCSVVYEAEDGVDALEKLGDVKPDILITDIKMPEIDGIALSKHIKDNRLPIKIVLLTGFADFEYARKAIEYDVVDFVLKPTTTESIVSAVNKAKAKIAEEAVTLDRIMEMENQFRENISQSLENEIRELISGIKDTPTGLEIILSQLNISVKSICALAVELDNADKDLQALKNMISFAFKKIPCCLITLKPDRLCLFLFLNEDGDLKMQMKTILATCEEVIGISNHLMRFSIYIGISDIHTSVNDISMLYREAATSLTYRFYDSTKKIIHMPYSKAPDNMGMSFMYLCIDRIIDCLQNGYSDKALEELKKMFNNIRENEYSVSKVKSIVGVLCSLIFMQLSNSMIDVSGLIDTDASIDASIDANINVYNNNIDSINTAIHKTKTLTSMFELLSRIIKLTATRLSPGETHPNYIVSSAQEYLNNNYSRNLSLKDIAAHIHVNSSYLSRLFKKVTGVTVTDTLTNIRVEKAKEILTTTDKKSYEIATMIGIEDPVYFSRLFKKHTGLSPKDFRRINKTKSN